MCSENALLRSFFVSFDFRNLNLFLKSLSKVESQRIGYNHILLGHVCFVPEVYLTNRFLAAVRLFSNRSKKTSKCGKNKKVAVMFLPHFDVFCDLLLNRRTATRNLFVYIINKQKLFMVKSSMRLSSNRS